MGSNRFREKDMMLKRKPPSLLKLCIQTTIDNVRYLGDVGETEIELLKDILPHCTEDQLMHIENSTQGRDLSPVTDKLWIRFYEKNFGTESLNTVIDKMKKHRVSFKWRKLYQAKLDEVEASRKEQGYKLKQRYEELGVKKQSKQVQLTTKTPLPGKRRNFYQGSGTYNNIPNAKGNLMRKSKMEFQREKEKIRSVTNKNTFKRIQSAPRSMKPFALGKDFASGSKCTKPFRRP